MNPANSQVKNIVITTTGVCIFGIVAYAKDIVDAKLEACFRDNKGRAVYGFYGFAVKVDEKANTIPTFSENDISEMYKHYIVPIWNDTLQCTQTPLSVSLEEKSLCSNSDVEVEYVWNYSVNVFSSEGNLYETMLYKALTVDIISYCSCINDYKALKKSPFHYVVTSPNNLMRLKKEVIVQEQPVAMEPQNHYNDYSKEPRNWKEH